MNGQFFLDFVKNWTRLFLAILFEKSKKKNLGFLSLLGSSWYQPFERLINISDSDRQNAFNPS